MFVIYASNTMEGRKELCEDLCHHQNTAMFRNKFCMIMGYFNEILEVEEISGCASGERISSCMREFQRMVLHCKFSNMGFEDLLFTWCNKREEGVI